MSTFGLASFNLLVNAAVSLLGAWIIVGLGTWLLRIRDGRLRIALLLLPFAKAVYELLRGIPQSSFFWAKLAGATQELGAFRIGFGVTMPFVPVVHVSLGAVSGGHTYAQGIGDLAATALARRLGPSAPVVLGLVLGAVVLGCVLVGAVRMIRAARERTRVLRDATVLEVRPLGGRRTVRIVIAEDVGAVPCAGGILRPWVCFPRSIFDALSHDEREAVIAHELAHIRHYDVLLLGVVAILRALFGFVPGAIWLARAIRAQCEIAADAAAARLVAPTTLASAIVRVAERACLDARIPSDELALIRPGRLLTRRITTLLGRPANAPSSRGLLVLRVAGVIVVAAAVMRATTLGNP
jgi:beta-lactamase regulating signal transducer with metallopeptidase domain